MTNTFTIAERELSPTRIRWRWGFGVAIAMLLVALFPQIHFAFYRGHDWHGANAITHPDEVAYSAYVASLIRGNPRRNDPYTARRGQAETTVPESLFSIQFVPACTVAVPARIMKISASAVFMVLPALCALAAALALFWFLSLLTRDERFSAAAVLIVSGFGTLIAGQGIVRHVPNLNYLIPLWISNRVSPTALYGLPLLRLYQPAVAFPLFFALSALLWLALTHRNRRRAIIAATGAGVAFALLIFSYFYLWTASAVWISCVCGLWLIARSADRKRTIMVFVVVATFATAALIPYLLMISHRAPTLDAVQALAFTHRPDLFRFPEIVAALVIALMAAGARRGFVRWREPASLVAMSFALTVFIVFNQQVISGRSLQPVHYQWFIANYCALVAVMLTVFVWSRNRGQWKLTNRRLAMISIVALLWAFGEAWLGASVAWDYNRLIDEAKPASNRLAQIASPAEAGAVLIADPRLADRLPTDAPPPVLWAPRMLVFPGVSESENRERFWQQLYYLGYDEKKFWAELDHADWNFLAGMFPYQRLSPAVSGNQTPITPEELRAQLAAYLNYARTFNRDRAASPKLSYLVVHADNPPDFTNLDRWYQRNEGERVGGFVLYRLKLRE